MIKKCENVYNNYFRTRLNTDPAKREIIANVGASRQQECVAQSHRCKSWHGV